MHTFKRSWGWSPDGGGCEIVPTATPGIYYCETHSALHAVADVVCDGHTSDDLLHLLREMVHAWTRWKLENPDQPVLTLVFDVSEPDDDC